MSQSLEVPPRPEEILDEDRIAYQAMADLSDEDYAKLAADIRDRGVLNTILLDEDGTILDGHHREAITQHYELDGSRAPTYLRIGDLESDDEKWARSIKQNLLGRDTTDAVKRQAVENYIKAVWPRDDDGLILDKYETEEQVADKLGVGQMTVARAKKSLSKSNHLSNIGHSRHLVRQYYEDNPDASYREVSENVDADVGKSTVGNWIKEDFEDDEEDEDDDQEPLNLFARDRDEDETNEELLEQVKDDDNDDGDDDDDGDEDLKRTVEENLEKVATRETTPDRAAAETEQAKHREKEEPTTETPPLPEETYRAIVIDPPWDIEKIERTERPKQGKYLDYPTMSLDEIGDLPVDEMAADSGAHVFLWTTHKHIPDALALFDEWGVRYECMMTWVKPTGVAPFSWQYNTEHVLFGRFGDGHKLEQQGLQLSFEAPVQKHSKKPDVFYDRVVEATSGPRLEMFARNARDGFEVWGDEVEE